VKVVLTRTEGYGLTADIEVNGQQLVVVDRVSASDREADPGPVSDPRFEVVTLALRSWERAFEDNAAREKKLLHQRGWRYLGFGEIASVEPGAVTVDLGVLVLELQFEDPEPDWAGEFIAIPIERIALWSGGGGR
jgi:hypothetical protein